MGAKIDHVKHYSMLNAQFRYNHLPDTDLDSVDAIIIGVLSGSLATAAGKVVFGWVPKINHWGDPHEKLNGRIQRSPNRRPLIPVIPVVAKQFGYSCYANGEYSHGGIIDSENADSAQSTLDSTTAGTGWACYLDVV